LEEFGDRLPDPQGTPSGGGGGGGGVQSVYIADPLASMMPMAGVGMGVTMSSGMMMGMSAVPRVII